MPRNPYLDQVPKQEFPLTSYYLQDKLSMAGGGSSVSASYADTASYTPNAVVTASLLRMGTGEIIFIKGDDSTFSITVDNVTSASYATTASYAQTASFFSGTVVSASYAQTASFFSGTVVSASYALTASYTQNAQPATTRKNANDSSNNNINYCGVALGTGVSESSAVWTITRLTIATSGSITTATATNVAWIDRETSIYT
jgi:hypothetical protein